MDIKELTPELKEKALACKTTEELAALAESEGVELSDEELDGISGGSWATDCPKEGCGDYRISEPCRNDERKPCYHDGML